MNDVSASREDEDEEEEGHIVRRCIDHNAAAREEERREDNKTSVNSSFRSDQQKMTRIRIASLQIKKSLKKEGTDERLDINNSSLSAKARSYLHGQRLKISVNDEIAEVKKISSSSDSLANRRNPRVLEFMKKKMRSRAD